MADWLTYAEYMASYEWRDRRDQYTLTHDYACHRCCKSNGLELHHRTYERLGAELDSDLCWLCEMCHILQHLLGTLDPGEPGTPTPEQSQGIGVATRAKRLPLVERYLVNVAHGLTLEEVRARAQFLVYHADVFA